MSTAVIQPPTHTGRKPFEIPLRLAAAILGVNFSHLRRVLNGERHSSKLSAAYQELVRAYWELGRAHQKRLCGLRRTRS